jgi:hypothetical protein
MKNPAPKLVVVLAFLVSCIAPAARADSLTNNFTTPQNYQANGIIGETNWDGVYMRFGDIHRRNCGVAVVTVRHRSPTPASLFPDCWAVQTLGSDWSNVGNDGFFLWKLVAG